MREIWLRPNRRALGVAMIAPAVVTCLGVTLAILGWWTDAPWQFGGGIATTGMGAVLLMLLWAAMTIPRLAYRDGELLVYLRTSRPIAVPIEVVESLFLGHGPAMLKGDDSDHATTRNVVVRIADTALDWHQRDVRSELGKWCDGYIVIRGTWCEPVSLEQLNKLNARLLELHRDRRSEPPNPTELAP